LTEEAGFNPLTAYAKSKVLAEEEISALADRRFSPVFLRNGTAYGPSPRLRLDLVLNNLVASAYATGRIYLKSDGTPWRPLVHIRDIARAFIAALQAPRETIHNQSFNVGGNEENYQVRDLAQLVKDAVPGSTIEYAPDAGPDARCYRVDFTKIRTKLPGFALRHNAREGTRELYAAYGKIGLNIEDLESSRYQRVKQIKDALHAGRLNENLRWRDEPVQVGAGVSEV
jgi:nucleoside-diphosphate-sugar epimerase